MVATREPRNGKKPSAFAISAAELLREMPHSRKVSFAPDEIIFKERSPAKDCYLIIRGKVRILKHTKDEGEVSLATVAAGEFLGEMAMISGEKRSATAIAHTRVEAVLIRHQDFELLLQQKHPFAARLSLQFSALLAARCQQLLGLIAQQKKTAALGQGRAKRSMDVRAVFNRVYTLWAV